MTQVAFRIKDENENIVDEGIAPIGNIGYITMTLAANNYTVIIKRVPDNYRKVAA